MSWCVHITCASVSLRGLTLISHAPGLQDNESCVTCVDKLSIQHANHGKVIHSVVVRDAAHAGPLATPQALEETLNICLAGTPPAKKTVFDTGSTDNMSIIAVFLEAGNASAGGGNTV